jgi:SagB-type dehydrogenase family enzyme
MIMFMTVNKEIRYALDYHEATKHSETSLMTSRHYLDFDNKPIPFKIYLELPSISLPVNFPTPEVNALTCISGMLSQRSNDDMKELTTKTTTSTTKPMDTSNTRTTTSTPNLTMGSLAEILFFSAGITRELNYPYGKYYMRAASATGALYPIELYVICGDISPDLVAGVYHFSPADFSLTQIRKGGYKRCLAAATANNQDIENSTITIIFTSFAWRNAWKYQARSYRHWFWDSGVIAANLLATIHAMGLPTHIITGFLDDKVSELLCLEDQREAPISMVAIGQRRSKDNVASSQQQSEAEILPHIPVPKIRALSKKGEISYPEIWELNRASKLTSKQEIEEWINNAHRHHNHQLISTTTSHHLQGKGAINDENNNNNVIIISNELKEDIKNSRSLKETILWRGSSRRFARTDISLSALKTILYSSTRGVPIDIFRERSSLIEIYFIANGVDGLTPGAYFYNRNISAATKPATSSIHKIREIASSRNISGYLCLGQSLFSDASVVFFLMTDLQSVLRSLGNRGYRASQFEAGIIAGKIYLSAYALRLGASGSTFFDDAVTEFFSPHASNRSTMIAVGVGIPAYKANPGKILPRRLTKEQLLTQDFI